MSQAGLAEILGVSQVTVARWETGQRPCQGEYAERILELETDRPQLRRSILRLATPDLGQLDGVRAEEVFGDLLWCRARQRQIPITSIRVASLKSSHPDGGIDISVDPLGLREYDELLSGSPSFQIKTGRNIKPWQESWVRTELFGSSRAAVDRSNLGGAVIRCLDCGGRYILVCFGCSLTSDETHRAREILFDYFGQCGYPEANVDVWGQEQLIGLLERYPSLCLKIVGRDALEFHSHASWAMNSEMTLPLRLGDDQKGLIREIRECIRGDAIRHVRVIGEPGLGKTRLVLEALSADDLAPLVVYVPHAEDFQRSRLFNELIRTDNPYFVVLVVDECASNERASIWDVLRGRSDRCRLVTIDHGPEDSDDNLMRVFNCPILPNEQITAIINDYVPSKLDSERWAEFCGGSPRVAHAVGRNLQRNPEDILKPPATVPIWDRFVAGYHSMHGRVAEQTLVVLRFIALFHRFGFEPPVESEAKFICELVQQQADSNLTWAQFQSAVLELRKRRILQGKTTLFIAPKALHIYLWLQFWEHHGRGFSLEAMLPKLPDELRNWFIRMFPYAHASPESRREVEGFLGPSGPFSDEQFVASPVGCKFLNALAEAAPKETLRCIERTFGSWGRDRLLQLEELSRQEVVWALEKIAVWQEYFCRAASVILSLAEAEEGTDDDHAGSTFVELFGWAASTETPPDQRLPVLKDALESNSSPRRQLGLRACESALSTEGGGRIVGTEYQGLRPTAKLWKPNTWAEYHEAFRDVWQLLERTRSNWRDRERTRAAYVLIEAAQGLIQEQALSEIVVTTLERLAEDDTTDLRHLVETVMWCLRVAKENLGDEVQARLRALDARITGTDFSSRVRRAVLLGGRHDEFDEKGNRLELLQERIAELAEECYSDPELLDPVVDELISGDNSNVFRFGHELGKRDIGRAFLDPLVKSQREKKESRTTLFFGGYLAAVFAANADDWEGIMEQLLRDDDYLDMVGDLVRHSGLTNGMIEKLITEHDNGRLPISAFFALRYGGGLRELSDDLVEKMLSRLIAAGQVACALELMDYIYCDKDERRTLPEKLAFELLVCDESADERREAMSNYYWSVIADQFIEQHSGRRLDLFRASLQKLCRQRWPVSSRDQSHLVLEKIIDANPEICWSIVASMLVELRGQTAWRIQRWLGPTFSFGEGSPTGPLILFPMESVLRWIDEELKERAPFMAKAMPKTLDASCGGALTREFLDRYGDDERVRDSLFSHFWAGGWSGPASKHYRRKRDSARGWLENKSSPRVIRWVEDYVEYLGHDIKRAEIEEEREF